MKSYLIGLSLITSVLLSNNLDFKETMLMKNANILLGKDMNISIENTGFNSEFGELYKLYINSINQVKLVFVSKTGDFIPFVIPASFLDKQKNNPYQDIKKVVEFENIYMGFKSFKEEHFISIGDKSKQEVYMLVDSTCPKSKAALKSITAEERKKYHFKIIITTLGEPMGIPSEKNVISNILKNTETFYLNQPEDEGERFEGLLELFENSTKPNNKKMKVDKVIEINQKILILTQFKRLPVVIKIP